MNAWLRRRAHDLLIEHWNGTRWSIVNTSNGRASGRALGRISCPTSAYCQATGSQSSNGKFSTLIERFA